MARWSKSSGASASSDATHATWSLKKSLGVWLGCVILALIAILTWLLGWPWDWGDRSSRDLLQTVQAVVLALGFLGVVAGAVVAYQRHETERSTLALERIKRDDQRDEFLAEQEQARVRSRHERFAQGSQMLAEVAPSLRIAGLNIIAAVGREVGVSDEYRQVAVNLICSYIRGKTGVDRDSGTTSDEALVITEACLLLPTLFDKLTYTDGRDEIEAPSIDLSGAVVPDLDLSGRVLGNVRFEETTFLGYLSLSGARALGPAMFTRALFVRGVSMKNCQFTRVGFREAKFRARADFEGFKVRHDAGFVGAKFEGDARFSHSNFGVYCWFQWASFGGVDFTGATFDRAAFTSALFNSVVKLEGVTFRGSRNVFADALFPHYARPEDLISPLPEKAHKHFEGAVFGGAAQEAVLRMQNQSSE